EDLRMLTVLDSSTTTNILLILYFFWILFGKDWLKGYSSKKGSNKADKEDAGHIESAKKGATQPYDIELEKIKAQAAYIVEEYKESLSFRIETKKHLYHELSRLKILIRVFYFRSTDANAQENYDNFERCLDGISDYMSCNKHFVNEIDPEFLISFEDKVNTYKQSFIRANKSILDGKNEESLIEERNSNATQLLDLIDLYLEKIFKISPVEVPYNKAFKSDS
ncbi:TPA: hypothetical protein ACGU7E_004753, partial [Vibrio vulnificus]